MRYPWLPVIVVVLDFISKIVLAYSPWSKGIYFLIVEGRIGIAAPGLYQANTYFTGDMNTGSIILFSGVLVIFLLLLRTAGGFISAFVLTAIGLQLAVGGIVSQVLDIFIHGHVIHPVIIQTLIPISISISDLAIAAGLVLLIIDLIRRQQIPKKSLIPLQESTVPTIDLSNAVIGIDNIHVDVQISPTFRGSIRTVVHDYLSNLISGKASTSKSSTPYSYALKNLRNQYFELISPELKRLKQEKNRTRFDLLYMAIIKLVQDEIKQGLDHFTYELKNNPIYKKPEYAKKGGKSTIQLLSSGSNTHYLLSREVFSQFSIVESEKLNPVRVSMFGSTDYPLAQLFKIPLLHAPTPLDDYVLCYHYLLMNHQNEKPYSFLTIDDLLARAFALNLDALPQTNTSELLSFDADSVNVGYQSALVKSSVLMAPHNITTLLDTNWSTNKLENARSKGDKHKSSKFKQHIRYQRYQLAILQNELEKSDLLHDLMVAITVTDHIREGKRNFDIFFINKLYKTLFLNTQKQMKNINPNLRRKILTELGLSSQTIDIIDKKLHSDLSLTLLRFVKDFSRYRRDLLLYHQVQQAVNKINFIELEKDILTSKANRSLYEFLTLDEYDESDDSELVHHAILKADLRGSTRITEELNKKGLNPATHFSRNFFDPINEVLPQYGAEKVFIEGDALILIFNEHSDMQSSHLCVSHACGVATDMLRIVDRQNKILEKYKLPILELGIGIAYNDTPPRYLFDEESKITISPAINRADRLSSCAWAIKTWLAEKIEPTTHVAMYEPSAKARTIGAKAEKEMIYNLNGILLEDAAYNKLSTELRLKRIKNEVKSLQDSILLASKYADTYGTMHTIIVRSAPVRVYDPSYTPAAAPEVDGRRYHEVIHDKTLINQIISQKKIKR